MWVSVRRVEWSGVGMDEVEEKRRKEKGKVGGNEGFI